MVLLILSDKTRYYIVKHNFKLMSEKKSPKHEINMKATLSAIKERQERLSQIKEKKDLKKIFNIVPSW